MQSLSSVNHFFPFISTNWLVSANFENMRFLGHYFEKLGSPWYLVSVLQGEEITILQLCGIFPLLRSHVFSPAKQGSCSKAVCNNSKNYFF